MNSKIFLAVTLFTFISLSSKAQQTDPNISPYWESYYDSRPSGIRENFQATDFIKIIDYFNFIPKSNLLQKNQQFLKKVLLMLDQNDLKQMSIDGWYYSMTKKHDDYFMLYNLTYQPISKDYWNAYCPYLIPLMSLDSTIKLNN
jgi:hypothetical protein